MHTSDVAGEESIQELQLKSPVILHKVGAYNTAKLCLTHTIWGFCKLTKIGSWQKLAAVSNKELK